MQLEFCTIRLLAVEKQLNIDGAKNNQLWNSECNLSLALSVYWLS